MRVPSREETQICGRSPAKQDHSQESLESGQAIPVEQAIKLENKAVQKWNRCMRYKVNKIYHLGDLSKTVLNITRKQTSGRATGEGSPKVTHSQNTCPSFRTFCFVDSMFG